MIKCKCGRKKSKMWFEEKKNTGKTRYMLKERLVWEIIAIKKSYLLWNKDKGGLRSRF